MAEMSGHVRRNTQESEGYAFLDASGRLNVMQTLHFGDRMRLLHQTRARPGDCVGGTMIPATKLMYTSAGFDPRRLTYAGHGEREAVMARASQATPPELLRCTTGRLDT